MEAGGFWKLRIRYVRHINYSIFLVGMDDYGYWELRTYKISGDKE